jgi:hypothetical protein
VEWTVTGPKLRDTLRNASFRRSGTHQRASFQVMLTGYWDCDVRQFGKMAQEEIARASPAIAQARKRWQPPKPEEPASGGRGRKKRQNIGNLTQNFQEAMFQFFEKSLRFYSITRQLRALLPLV